MARCWSGVAAQDNLETRSGILGVAKHYGSTAAQITEATARLIQEFATKRVAGSLPKQWLNATTAPEHDKNLERHACDILHMLNVDSAADELLSGQMMQGRAGAGADSSWGGLFKNLETVIRDKPHGQRRTAAFLV